MIRLVLQREVFGAASEPLLSELEEALRRPKFGLGRRECALEFRADLLVTGNKSHFPRRYRRTLVVNPREFWEEYLLESGVR